MSAEPIELARTQRLIRAHAETVYAAIDGIDSWQSWMSRVVTPVQVVDDRSFEVTAADARGPKRHSVVVKARGPVHSLTVEVDGRYQLEFRLRPHPLGADVEAYAVQFGKQRLLDRLSRRRRSDLSTVRLRAVLAELAAHVE